MKFRKKPIVISAIQFKGHYSIPEILEFAVPHNIEVSGDHLEIMTLEGVMRASPSDWIIKGVNGEIYPCKSDIFDKTYERVQE